MRKAAFSALLFALPYIAIEFINTIFIIIDQSISNSIGETALIVFSSFITLNWAINTIMWAISSAFSMVFARDKKNRRDISTTGAGLELMFNLTISALLLVFAEQITYVYQLDDAARNILTIILRLKAIQLPLNSIGIIAENDLKIRGRVKAAFIIMAVASGINILGDLISVWSGFNEVGIYVSTIISSFISMVLLLFVSKFRVGKFRWKYAKEMLRYTRDIAIDKFIQRFVNIAYTSIASLLGTEIYAIHCACVSVSDMLDEICGGYREGLLINYAGDINAKRRGLLKKADTVAKYGTGAALVLVLILTYPLWWLLGRAVPWEECNPYVWFYVMEFVTVILGTNYQAYLQANKFTKPIRKMALIGGVLVRLPLLLLFRWFGFGLLGLSMVCALDRLIRAAYVRISIQRNQKLLFT